MLYTYKVLKSSWGIVIFLDAEESHLINQQNDINLFDNIFIRINEKRFSKDKILYWLSHAILDAKNEIKKNISTPFICFEINLIDFSYTDFQEEGLYYAMQGWLSEKYSMSLPNSEVFYDQIEGKYVFPHIKAYLINAPK